jgi:ankyrin repeat protein
MPWFGFAGTVAAGLVLLHVQVAQAGPEIRSYKLAKAVYDLCNKPAEARELVQALNSLVEQGADVEGKTSAHGVSALMKCAVNGEAAAVEVLLDAGGDPTRAATPGWTAILLAAGTQRAQL